MPRIDNGTGRDISKWNGTLEKSLIARKDMLNKCKTNNDLIDVLMDCEKDGLSAEGTAYTDRLIATISSNPNFRKNFQNVYNVLLKGTGNGVLKCSAKKPAKKGLKESVPDFGGCSHFYRFGDVVELAQTNPAAFGSNSTFLSELEGAEDLLNKPGYADAFVECPDGEDIAPNTIQVWYIDNILDTVDATAKFLLPDDSFGLFCDRCALLSFWDYLAVLYTEVGEDLSIEDYGWETVNTDVFQYVKDSDSVRAKHVGDYTHTGNITDVPETPSTIEIAGHTIDLDQDPSSDVVVFDGVVAEYDEREELIDAENHVLYATVGDETYTIILFYRRHGLLADVAVLEPDLTAVVKNKLV